MEVPAIVSPLGRRGMAFGAMMKYHVSWHPAWAAIEEPNECHLTVN